MYIGDIEPYPISLQGTLDNVAPFQQNGADSQLGNVFQNRDKYFGEFTDVGIEQLIKMGIPVTKIEGTFERNGKIAHKVYVSGLLE